MTEADGGGPDAHPDEPTDDDVTLKGDSNGADDTTVFDGIGGKPRLTWSSVTDSGNAPPPTPSPERDRTAAPSGFQFDLGGALARLGGDDPTPDPGPVARHEPPALEPEPAPRPAFTEPEPGPAVVEPEPPVSRPSVSEPISTTTDDRHPSPEPVQPDAERPLIDVGQEQAPPAAAEPPTSRPPVSEPVDDRRPSPEPVQPDAERPWIDRYQEQATPPAAEPPAPRAVEPPAATAEPDYPRRIPGAHLDPRHRLDDVGASPVEPRGPGALPPIREATPADEVPRRTAPPASVFGEAGAAGSAIAGAPSLPGVPASMPTLPASNPAAPPPIAEPVTDVATAPDLTALRSAQLKAKRQQRQGKLFGRSLLAFVVVGGLIAAAMLFGRSLLFDTDWDGRLTSTVNEVEAERGASFERTVPLVTVGASEFGDRALATMLGSDWLDRVPEWRALNLAVGEVTADSVADELSRERQAFYDAERDEIVMVEGAGNARVDLRIALEAAYDMQQGAEPSAVGLADHGFAGVSPLASIADEAVDRYLANRVGERPVVNAALPLPIAYQLAATTTLGESILIGADVDPASVTFASPAVDDLDSVLADDAVNTPSGTLQPGDRSLSDSVALGTDDWSLVWATRLPESTVIRLVDEVIADSYRTVERGDTTCAIGVFETATEAAGGSVFSSMLIWAAAAPPASQTVATQIGPTRVQIDACDPGVTGGIAGNPGVVDDLIDRQQRRLTS